MRKLIFVVLVGAFALALPAAAELENVVVGGSIQIRGDYIHNAFTGPNPVDVRWGPLSVAGRPIGGPFAALGVVSPRDWDSRGNDLKIIEQRTRLNVSAEFTDNVKAFIEIDSYDVWGEDFRSDYVTGMDMRGNSVDDVEIFQSYIEADQMWDTGLRLRVGRQELMLGSEWLVGNQDNALLFTGLSFDAVRLTYTEEDMFTIDAFVSKLVENSPAEEDGDADLYGVYGSYLGIEDMTIDAYWLFVRDARAIVDVQTGPIGEWLQDVAGVDDYDPTQLHTVGLRAAGNIEALDFEAEVAYQFGEADVAGSTFKRGLWGDQDAHFGNWGAHADVGYTLDVAWNPRIFAGGAFFQGEDNRDISLWDAINPFYRPEPSISFNRLFSDTIYSGAMDALRCFSNGWLVRGGVSAMPTEKLSALLMATYFQTFEPFERPVALYDGGWFRIPSPFPWWTIKNDKELGVDLCLLLTYHYSEDLSFEAGWCHFFTMDGAAQGNYSLWNGLLNSGGTDDEDADYWYVGSKLKF